MLGYEWNLWQGLLLFCFLSYQSSYKIQEPIRANSAAHFNISLHESHFGSWTLALEFPYKWYLSESSHKNDKHDKVMFRCLLRNFWRIVLIELRRNSPASPSAWCFWSSAQRLRDKITVKASASITTTLITPRSLYALQ